MVLIKYEADRELLDMLLLLPDRVVLLFKLSLLQHVLLVLDYLGVHRCKHGQPDIHFRAFDQRLFGIRKHFIIAPR